jgi:hypothetical protein
MKCQIACKLHNVLMLESIPFDEENRQHRQHQQYKLGPARLATCLKHLKPQSGGDCTWLLHPYIAARRRCL